MKRTRTLAAVLCLALAAGPALQGCRPSTHAEPAQSADIADKDKAHATDESDAEATEPEGSEPDETSGEGEPEQPDLKDIADANRLSLLVGEAGPVHIVEETYDGDGLLLARSDVRYFQGSGGIVSSTAYTDVPAGKKDEYFRLDGKQYVRLADGTLIMRAAVTSGALQRYYDYYDKVESPFLYSKDEEMASCVLSDGVFEVATRLDLAVDRDLQRTSGLKEGISQMNLKVDARSLQVLEVDSRLLSTEGETLHHSKLTVETGAGAAYIPEFMAEFRNPSRSKTVTLVFDPGDEEEQKAYLEMPANAMFETMDEDFYTAYVDPDGTMPYDASSSKRQPKNLTLYLYRE